jgi:ribose/xylose/arabinose/galactoside ABC-type transport system permease subunit
MGALNGVLIAVLRVQPVVVTLSMCGYIVGGRSLTTPSTLERRAAGKPGPARMSATWPSYQSLKASKETSAGGVLKTKCAFVAMTPRLA